MKTWIILWSLMLLAAVVILIRRAAAGYPSSDPLEQFASFLGWTMVCAALGVPIAVLLAYGVVWLVEIVPHWTDFLIAFFANAP